MRLIALGFTVMLLAASVSLASTVNLSNGGSIQGDIVKKDSKSIQINVDGVKMTYYADEIKDVDGQPFAQAPAATDAAPAATVAAAAPAETAPADQAAPAESAPAQTPPAETAAAQPPAANGTLDGEKKQLILKFIDVFGTRQALINNFDVMLQQIEKEKPDEAKKIRDRVKIDEIIERLLPIYDRNFSTEDLKAFIAFYSSSEGQKLIGTIPELMKESVQESVKYMEEKFPEVKPQG